MNDSQIIVLLFNRDETAIKAIQEKYHDYCYYISNNILHNEEDVKECINEAWGAVWNSIPPHSPDNLKTYIGKLIREISISKYRKNTATKRLPDGSVSSLEEIENLVSDNEFSDRLEQEELARAISTFLYKLPEIERNVMIHRYWHNESIKEICAKYRFGESKVKVMLKRSRDKLRKFLKDAGFII